MHNNAPIGIFDSGVGGTSIWKEMHALLPRENTCYLADSAHAPYGEKPEREIVRLSIKNTEKLLAMGCKLIVVACNTATTNAISLLRKNYSVPFIGIEPAIKPATLQSKNKSIGILATKGTLGSTLFHKTSKTFAKDISVVEVIGEGIVPRIENGDLSSEGLKTTLQQCIRPMLAANVDYIVLGCSHYPHILPLLKTLVPQHVTIIDSGKAVARQTQAVLKRNKSLRKGTTPPSLRFFTNAGPRTLQQLLKNYRETVEISVLDF